MKILKQRWVSPRITFGFLNCPTCKENKINAPHLPVLNELIVAILKFESEVREKAKQRIKFEGMHNDPPLKDKNSPYFNNLEAYAMFKLAYY